MSMIGSKSKRIAALAMAASMLFASACGSTSGSGPVSETADPGSSGGSSTPLVIAMTAANVPVPDTNPTEAGEGWRFVTYQLYDGLVNWDLLQADRPAGVRPGLAESWEHDEEDPTLWTFRLRQGVAFHDGTPFNADAAVFGLDRVLNADSPFYNAKVAGGLSAWLKYIDSYQKIDDYTLQIKTKEPYSFLLYDLAFIVFASPEAVKQYGEDYASHPSGTGPFRFVGMKQGQEMILERNTDYWGMVPRIERVILRPMSDASSRLAALQSGEVNWAEIPPPEAMELLKASGFEIYLNSYPHIWPLQLNMQEGPLADKRVRQALNYAIDRKGMSEALLGGVAVPATQFMYPGHPWHSEDALAYSYDPEKAKQLLAEAGYGDGFETTFVVPTNGSGAMWPLQMNEFIQKNLKDIGVEVKIEALEWQAMLTQFRSGFPEGGGIGAYNMPILPVYPTVFERSFASYSKSPNGSNAPGFANAEFDELIKKARQSFDDAERDAFLRQASDILAEEAPWIYVVHDQNLRVMSGNVKGFVQPQSSYVDLTTITIE